MAIPGRKYIYDVFVSYSSKDKEWVKDVLLPKLKQRGIRYCIDYRDFMAGKPWLMNVQDAVKTSRHIIFVVTPNWMESEWTSFEAIIGGIKYPARDLQRMIPLLVMKCEVPDMLKILTSVDLTDPSSRAAAWKLLFTTLKKTSAVKHKRSQVKQVSQSEILSKAGHIFMSYRRTDSADITGRIYDRLVYKFGKKPIFKDVDSIPLGVDFKEYLDRKVGECDVLLAIIGDRWLEASDANGNQRLNDPADFVRMEIEFALRRGIPVIPLLVRGAQMPGEEKLPTSLRKLAYRNGIPIRPDPDFHRDMDRLISALEKISGERK